MEIICQQKTTLIKILSGGAKFVLQHVHQAKLITGDEYGSLKDDISHHSRQDFTINLLDKMIEKGDKQCHKFLKLLELKEMRETFPQLNDLSLRSAVTQGDPKQEISDPPEVDEYKMSSVPRGVCVIINNVHFERHTWLEERSGSNADEKSLKKVFCWLGFTLEVHRDQTAQQMKDLLKQLSQKNHEGDCFVCCILSHGCAEGVYGTDGGVVCSEDMFPPFRGTSCRSLAGKPKVFFIQACRGEDYQLPVEVEADSREGDEAAEEAVLEMDAVEMFTIPNDADFFVARSTVKGFVSFRNTLSGSWFIQSLCKQLEAQRADIQSILVRVNWEVSRKAKMDQYGKVKAKQMPVQKVTLRKKLVFQAPS